MSEWKKVRLGDVCEIEKGSTGIASAIPGEYPLVVTAAERKTSDSYQFDCAAVCIPLVSSKGHGVKALNNVHYQEGKFALGTILCAVIPKNPEELSARYLHQYLQFNKDRVLVPLMKGAANVSLAVKDIASVEIPVPSIDNQKYFADLLNKVQLKGAKIQQEFEKQKDILKKLRQSVLQDAIEGKLTEDWRKKHPVIKGDINYDAEALYNHIQQEKQKMIVEKKFRKENFQKPIYENNLVLPCTWRLELFGNVAKQITDGTHQTPRYVEKGEIFLSAQNIKPFKFMPESHKYVPSEDFELYTKNRVPELNDLLIGRVGSIGECAVINQDIKFAFYVSLALVKLFSNVTNPKFYAIVMNSKYGADYAKNNVSSLGASAGNFNLGHIRSFKIPLPPLAEQNEIVSRVEMCFLKIDELELQIATRETYAKTLLQTTLHSTFQEG